MSESIIGIRNLISELLKESSISGLVSSLFVTVGLLCSIFGVALGIFAFSMMTVNESMRELKTTYRDELKELRDEIREDLAVHETYFARLDAWARANNINLPPKPTEEKLDE